MSGEDEGKKENKPPTMVPEAKKTKSVWMEALRGSTGEQERLLEVRVCGR